MTLADVMRQMIEEALYSASISSAGGDSPKKNYVFDGTVDINPTDFENILNNEVKNFMEERLPVVIEEQGEEIKKSIVESPQFQDAVNVFGLVKGGPTAMLMSLGKLIAPIMILLMAPKMAEEVFKWLTRPGGFLDLRFKRVLENEYNAFQDRQTQYNTQVGLRQVIITSTAGFRNINGIANENTLRQIKMGGTDGNRLALIERTEHAKGLWD